MSCCRRRANPYGAYADYHTDRTYTPEEVAAMISAGLISSGRAAELLALPTHEERTKSHEDLAFACQRGDQAACAELEALGRDPAKTPTGMAGTRSFVQSDAFKYGAIATGVAGLAYLFKRNK